MLHCQTGAGAVVPDMSGVSDNHAADEGAKRGQILSSLFCTQLNGLNVYVRCTGTPVTIIVVVACAGIIDANGQLRLGH